MNLGIAQLRQGRPTEAVDSLLRVVALKPDSMPARTVLAAALRAGDDREDDDRQDGGGQKIRLSLVIPTFNRASCLEALLATILPQIDGDRADTVEADTVEIVISDNASTDRTEELCRAMAAACPFLRYHRTDSNLALLRGQGRQRQSG